MGKEELVERILSDARASAEETVRAAKARAEEIVQAAKRQREEDLSAAAGEAEERGRRISEGRAAEARLDGAKIYLAQKKRVIDAVYLRALASLLCLERHDAVLLSEKLLKEYAEEGDEIVFSPDFPYAEQVMRLPVVKEKKLKMRAERQKTGGGFWLCGKTSDKDVTYSALLAADREENQAEIALALFGANR